MPNNDDLIKIYTECSNCYHKVDDFRAKLLGFLPLASGIGIFGSLYKEIKPDSKNILSDNHIALGTFGMMVTLGLLIYELKGIVKCTQFINLGKWIEGQLQGNDKRGYFTELLQGSIVVNEPVASAIIYSTVMAGWSYVIVLNYHSLQYIIPIVVFAFCVVLVYAYWWVQSNSIKQKIANYPDIKNVKEDLSRQGYEGLSSSIIN